VQTNIGHDTGLDAAALATAEGRFTYSARDIRYRLASLRWREVRSERWLAQNGVPLLRLSYEQLAPLAPEHIAEVIAAHVGVKLPPAPRIEVTHRKLGSDKNIVFAERFRSENAALLARIEAERAPMIAALSTLSSVETSL